MDAPKTFILMNGSTTLSSIQCILLQHSPSCDLLLEASGFHRFNCSSFKVCTLLRNSTAVVSSTFAAYSRFRHLRDPCPVIRLTHVTTVIWDGMSRGKVTLFTHSHSFPVDASPITNRKKKKHLPQMCCWAHGAFLVLITRWQAVNQWEMFLSETICWCSANPVWVCSGCWLSPEAARSWERSAWNNCHKVHSFFLGVLNPLELCDFGL